MRKACMAGISVLIGISMLAGCGKSLDADTDTVYVQKNGTVLSVDVETLDKDYYDETELKDYVTDAVSTYTGEHGKSAVRVEDGKVTGTATKEEIYSGEDLKVVIIKANRDVKVDGTICYVSSENVKLTGTDSVSIRDGYSLNSGSTADESDSDENIADGTESIGGSTEVSDTDVNDDTTYVKDDGAFETDVYTYIIYK